MSTPTCLGTPVRENPFLVGSKIAYLCDGILNVSPAMWSLMRTATPEELKRLLKAIKVKKLNLSFDYLDSLRYSFLAEGQSANRAKELSDGGQNAKGNST